VTMAARLVVKEVRFGGSRCIIGATRMHTNWLCLNQVYQNQGRACSGKFTAQACQWSVSTWHGGGGLPPGGDPVAWRGCPVVAKQRRIH